MVTKKGTAVFMTAVLRHLRTEGRNGMWIVKAGICSATDVSMYKRGKTRLKSIDRIIQICELVNLSVYTAYDVLTEETTAEEVLGTYHVPLYIKKG